MQNSIHDIIIAGAGLGGMCAALWLSGSRNVTILSGTAPAASAIAAGLVNPYAGQRMSTFWNSDIAYRDLLNTLVRSDALETYNPCGILRPAMNEEQALHFRTLSAENPNSITWIPPRKTQKDYPYVSAPFGAAITTGGILNTPQLLERMLIFLASHCKVLHENLAGWRESDSDVTVTLRSGTTLKTKKLILALGAGYTSFPGLSNLNLHLTKGQIVYVRIPENASISLPVSGHGYAVPSGGKLILGTTYEHAPADSKPSKEGMNKILCLTEKMIPSVGAAEILSTSAGIRVGVPGTRLPMVGPLTRHVWILTGLGSKGLLFGAHIGRNLESWITDPLHIPDNYRPKNLTSKISVSDHGNL
ncbi:MAG: FAD-dependent oxidoreductase [Bacteroidetes bacterium]|nr:FAD-dependent oxidoreductase [Bacteroidota bacterium]